MSTNWKGSASIDAGSDPRYRSQQANISRTEVNTHQAILVLTINTSEVLSKFIYHCLVYIPPVA